MVLLLALDDLLIFNKSNLLFLFRKYLKLYLTDQFTV